MTYETVAEARRTTRAAYLEYLRADLAESETILAYYEQQGWTDLLESQRKSVAMYRDHLAQMEGEARQAA